MVYEEEINFYLNKNYSIIDKKYFKKNDNLHEWGWDILKTLPIIFGYEIDKCKEVFESWSLNNGFSFLSFEEDLRLAMHPVKLKTIFSPELMMDLTALRHVDGTQELLYILSEQIYGEIGHDILVKMRDEIKTEEDFLGVMKCIGFTLGPTLYDPMSFRPTRNFMSINHHESIKERKKNRIWRLWETKKR
jgi:hypothetical protein